VPKVWRQRVKPWSPERLGEWLDAIETERLYPLFDLGVFAGLRRGELCGLSWDDLDAGRIIVGWQITGISYRKGRKTTKE
jgi:integrase